MEGMHDKYAPLELGTVGPALPATHAAPRMDGVDGSPGEAGRAGAAGGASDPNAPGGSGNVTRRRWAGLGAALVIGAVVGVVGANARETTAEYGQVELIAGTAEVVTSVDDLQLITVNLVNTGPRDIDILDVDVNGFVKAPGPDLPESTGPVTAAPGEWAQVRTTVVPDCETRPSGAVRAHVRTTSGEQTVEIPPPPGENPLSWMWDATCAASVETRVFIQEVQTLSSDATAARVVLPVLSGMDQPVEIVTLSSSTPGFTAVATGLPVEVFPNNDADIETSWTVTDCADAAQFTEATVDLNVRTGERAETRLSHPLGNPVITELVRLAIRVCET